MLPRPDPPQDVILENFRYDPEIGALYWIAHKGSSRKDAMAGFIGDHDYWIIGIGKKQYKAHRLIWVYHFGPIDIGLQVDHKNGIRSDNHIENLQLTTPLGNSQNQRRHKNNASGIRGVYYVRSRKRWWYQRQFNKRKVLRCFRSKAAAIEFALKTESAMRRFQTRLTLEAPKMEQDHGFGLNH